MKTKIIKFFLLFLTIFVGFILIFTLVISLLMYAYKARMVGSAKEYLGLNKLSVDYIFYSFPNSIIFVNIEGEGQGVKFSIPRVEVGLSVYRAFNGEFVVTSLDAEKGKIKVESSSSRSLTNLSQVFDVSSNFIVTVLSVPDVLKGEIPDAEVSDFDVSFSGASVRVGTFRTKGVGEKKKFSFNGNFEVFEGGGVNVSAGGFFKSGVLSLGFSYISSNAVGSGTVFLDEKKFDFELHNTSSNCLEFTFFKSGDVVLTISNVNTNLLFSDVRGNIFGGKISGDLTFEDYSARLNLTRRFLKVSFGDRLNRRVRGKLVADAGLRFFAQVNAVKIPELGNLGGRFVVNLDLGKPQGTGYLSYYGVRRGSFYAGSGKVFLKTDSGKIFFKSVSGDKVWIDGYASVDSFKANVRFNSYPVFLSVYRPAYLYGKVFFESSPDREDMLKVWFRAYSKSGKIASGTLKYNISGRVIEGSINLEGYMTVGGGIKISGKNFKGKVKFNLPALKVSKSADVYGRIASGKLSELTVMLGKASYVKYTEDKSSLSILANLSNYSVETAFGTLTFNGSVSSISGVENPSVYGLMNVGLIPNVKYIPKLSLSIGFINYKGEIKVESSEVCLGSEKFDGKGNIYLFPHLVGGIVRFSRNGELGFSISKNFMSVIFRVPKISLEKVFPNEGIYGSLGLKGNVQVYSGMVSGRASLDLDGVRRGRVLLNGRLRVSGKNNNFRFHDSYLIVNGVRVIPRVAFKLYGKSIQLAGKLGVKGPRADVLIPLTVFNGSKTFMVDLHIDGKLKDLYVSNFGFKAVWYKNQGIVRVERNDVKGIKGVVEGVKDESKILKFNLSMLGAGFGETELNGWFNKTDGSYSSKLSITNGMIDFLVNLFGEDVRGKWDFSGEVKGKKYDFEIFGNGFIKTGKIKFSFMPDYIDNLSGRIMCSGKQIKISDLVGYVEDSRIKFGGELVLGKASVDNISFRLMVDDEVPVSSEGETMSMSGYVKGYVDIKGDPKFPKITGDISVRKADIFYNFTSSSRSGKPSFSERADWNLRVKLVDGGKLSTEAVSFILKPKQSLIVKGSIVKDTFTLSGTLEVDRGVVYFLGNSFFVENMKIAFPDTPGVVNPMIVGVASKRFIKENGETVKITLTFNGFISKLAPQITSSPPMSSREIGKLLGIETGWEELYTGETFEKIVMGSVNVLENVSIMAPISQQFRRTLGLDLLRIRSNIFSKYVGDIFRGREFSDVENLLEGTEVDIGKFVFRNVFMRYGFSLKKDVNSELGLYHTFGVELMLNPFDIEWSYLPVEERGRYTYEHKFLLRWKRRF